MRFVLMAFFTVAFFVGFSQQMTVYKSKYSVDETVEKIVETINQKKLVHFETVNHDKVAEEYGVTIPPTRIILFEDPNLMIELVSCRQTTALDLPMKILVWEENEDIYIGFFDPKVEHLCLLTWSEIAEIVKQLKFFRST